MSLIWHCFVADSIYCAELHCLIVRYRKMVMWEIKKFNYMESTLIKQCCTCIQLSQNISFCALSIKVLPYQYVQYLLIQHLWWSDHETKINYMKKIEKPIKFTYINIETKFKPYTWNNIETKNKMKKSVIQIRYHLKTPV